MLAPSMSYGNMFTSEPSDTLFIRVAKLAQSGYSDVMNKGVKSSEFWINLLAVGAPAAQSAFTGRTDSTSVIVSGLLAAIYTIARAYLKGRQDPPRQLDLPTIK